MFIDLFIIILFLINNSKPKQKKKKKKKTYYINQIHFLHNYNFFYSIIITLNNNDTN